MENNDTPSQLEGGDFGAMMDRDQASQTAASQQAATLAALPVQVPMAPSVDVQPAPVVDDTPPPTAALPHPVTQLDGSDFGAIMDRDQANQYAHAKANFMASEGKDPDRSGQAYSLAVKAQTDPSFVDRNYDKLKSGIEVNEIDFAKLSRLHPSIANLANNPVKAAAIRDQVTDLSKFDNAVKDHSLLEDAYNLIGYGTAGVLSNLSKVPAAMYDTLAFKENARRYMRGDKSRVTSDDTFFGRNNIATLTFEEMQKSFGEKLPILNEQAHESFLKTVHSAANASFPERVVDAITQGDYVRGGQVLLAHTAAFVPTLVAMAGAAMINPAIAPAMFGATSLAEHNARNLEEGMDPVVGVPNAAVHGAIDGYFSHFGINAYFNTVAGRLSAKFGPEVASQVMKSYGETLISAAGGMAKATVAEGGVMTGMSLAGDFADFAMGTNPDALKGSLGRAADAFMMGGLMGGATHMGGEAVVKAHEVRRASAVRDFMADLVEKAKTSKLNERSPELHTEFVKDAVAGTDAESVQLTPHAIETFFQSKGVNPVKAMQDLGFLAEFGHAKETGTNVKIPSETFIQYVAKNGYEELVNDVKVNEEELSVNETNARAAVEAAFNKVDDQGIRREEPDPLQPGLDRRGLTPDQSHEEQTEAIRKEFSKQLVAAGQDPSQAIVLSKIFQTQAERTGVSPLELYNKYLVRINDKATSEGIESNFSTDVIGRLFNQEDNGGSSQTLPEQTVEAGQRQGDGGGQGALPEAVRGGAEKLPKLPSSSPGGVAGVRERARAFVESRGGTYRPQSEYVTVDPARATRIAEAYEQMEHRPDDPEVKAAYDAMINETVDQYHSIIDSGLKIEAIKPGQENPYPNGSADMIADVAQGHLWFFPTDQGFGSEANPDASIFQTKSGQTVRLEIEPHGGQAYNVKALNAEGQTIGSVFVENMEDDSAIAGNQLHVDSEYRGQGIAQAMYDFAEERTGRSMQPSEFEQSADGEAFWEKRNNRADERSVLHPATAASADNPLLRQTGERLHDGTELRANDLFRIVHDYYGHAKEGVSFGANGEENAWQSHVRMYSPLAARAMTTETRGQNSWVNFGPKGEANRADPANTNFADQKTGLLPEWVSTEGLDKGKRTLFQGGDNVIQFKPKRKTEPPRELSKKELKETSKRLREIEAQIDSFPEDGDPEAHKALLEEREVLNERRSRSAEIGDARVEAEQEAERPFSEANHEIPTSAHGRKMLNSLDARYNTPDVEEALRDGQRADAGPYVVDDRVGGIGWAPNFAAEPTGVIGEPRIQEPHTLNRKGRKGAAPNIDPLSWSDSKYNATKELLAKHKERDMPVVINTSSDLVAKADYIEAMPKDTTVNMYLTTSDDQLNRALFPGNPSRARQEKAVTELRAAGVKVNVIKPSYDSIVEAVGTKRLDQAYGGPNWKDQLKKATFSLGVVNGGGRTLFQSDLPRPAIDPLGFFSQVDAEVGKMEFKAMPAKDLLNRIKNIQGIKKEELEALGLEDYLNLRAEGPSTVSYEDVVASAKRANNDILEGGTTFKSQIPEGQRFQLVDIPVSKISAGNERQETPDKPLHIEGENDESYAQKMANDPESRDAGSFEPVILKPNGDGTYRLMDGRHRTRAAFLRGEDTIQAYVPAEKSNGKVTKEEIQEFVRNNGLKLEQTVLGADYVDPNARDRDESPTVDDVDWRDAQRDYSLDSDDIDHEYNYLRNDVEDDYWDDEQADFFAENMEEYTDEDGEVDQAGLEKAWETELDKLARKRAEDLVNDPDYGNARYIVHEIASGTSIYGSDDLGWADGEGNDLGYNLNEARIQHVNNLLENGELEYPHEGDDEDTDEGAPMGEGPNKVTGRSRFGSYTVKGATNYREILLKLPGNTFEHRGHFPGHKGLLAHLRVSDRVDALGRKVLFIEELQSDLHQRGREKGYRGERFPDFPSWLKDTQGFNEEQVIAETSGVRPIQWAREPSQSEMHQKYNLERQAHDEAAPDAPFKQTDAWTALALKRMLRMAVEEGYDSLAWTPAEVHVERWGTDDVTWVRKDLKFSIEKTEHGYGIREASQEGFYADGIPTEEEARQFIKNESGPRFIVGSVEQRGGRADGTDIEALARQRGELLERNGERVTTKDELRKVIGDTLGRERDERSLDSLTDRVWKQMESGDPSGALQPRAEGMKAFYDRMIPDTMKKILKKIDPGAKVEVGGIQGGEKAYYSERLAQGEYTVYREGTSEQLGKYETLEEAQAAAEGLNEKHPPVMATLKVDLTDTLKKVVGEQGLALFQKTDGTPRGQIVFGKNSADISFFAKANKSTFFHEVGHFVVEMMKDMSSIEDAPQQVKDDYAMLMKFVGHEGGEITTEQHEKIARGFEEYIMEGKAPSMALARAFTRFKTWMYDVYKQLLNNDVELSEDVRGVFDRMLATDAEIEHAQSIQDIKPLFTEETLPKGVHDRYMKAFEQARQAADDELRVKVMEDIRKKERALYKEQLKESVTRVTERVKKMPVYQAMHILQYGKTMDDRALPESLKDVKIDRAALVEEFGKDVIQKLPKPVVYGKDGMHHDIVADLLGYESGKAMIEDFTKYPKMKEYIDSEVKADMQLKSPDLFKSDKMPEAAMEAIHNDRRGDVLRMELDMLRDQNPGVVRDLTERMAKRPQSSRQMQEQMEGVIGAQVVTEVSPNKYRVAERQAGREAAKAFANGDMQAAFDAKTKELKNYQLFKAASAARAEMDKSMKFFKKLGQSDEKLAKTRDINLVNTARAVLASYGIGKTDAAPIEYLKKMQAYDPEAFEAATYHVHAATEGGNAQNYKQLTMGQFRTMSDSVKALYELAKSSKEIEIGGKKMQRDQVVNDLIAQLSNHGDLAAPRAGMAKAITLREKTNMSLMGAKAALRRVEHWAHAVDGEDYGGVTVKTLVEPIKEAETALHLKKVETMKHYRDNVVLPSKDVFKKRTIDAPEIGYKFGSKSELLGALQHIGNESNFSKLLRGRGWGDITEDGTVDRSRFNQMVDRLQKDGTLVKADYDYLQGLWDMYEKMKPDAQKAHFKMFGFHFNEITAEPFQTPFGEYKGGYAPALADPNISEDAALRREKESFGNNQNMMLLPTGGRGFTKSRVEAYAAPLAMDLGYVPLQIDRMLRFTYMEPVVRDLSKIVFDRKFTNALGAVDSSARAEMLVPYLQRAATQSTTTPSGTGKGWKDLDTAFRKMRGSTGLNAMTLNIVNAFHQLTGFSVAAALVEPKYLRDATWRISRRSAEVTEAMHEKSAYMRAKESGIGELQQNIEELMNEPGKFTKTVDWIKANSYVLQKFSAGLTETVAWTAGYDKAIAEGKTEAEAVAFGDSVVRRTQHSASPSDVSRFGTGTPLMRLFTMYFDYFNNKANLNLTQAGNLTRELGMKKGLLHMAPLYVSTIMIPAIMTKLAYRAASGNFDENDDGNYMDDFLKLFFHSQFDELLTTVPMLGPMVTAGINTFNDNPSDDRMSLSPAVEVAMRSLNMPRHMSDFVHGRGKPSKAIKDVFSLVGLFSGLPIQPLAKPIGYAADVASGQVESHGPLDYARGLVTGMGSRH